jgi:hypothetical protein
MPRRPPLVYRHLPERFQGLQQQHDDTQRQQDGVVVDPTGATGDPNNDGAVFAYGDLSDFGIDGYGAACWHQASSSWVQLPGAGGAGGYASLTGPGQTTTPGALTQAGGFTVQDGDTTHAGDGITLTTNSAGTAFLANYGAGGVALSAYGTSAVASVQSEAGGVWLYSNDGTGPVKVGVGSSAQFVTICGSPTYDRLGFFGSTPIAQGSAASMTTLAALVSYLHAMGLLGA